MTLHQATTLAISAHAASVATAAVASLPPNGWDDMPREFIAWCAWHEAEKEARRRWRAVRKLLTGKRRIAA